MAVMTTRVASAEHVAGNVIQLRLVKPEGFTWKTGEFARVGLKIEGDEVFRAYSIGSGKRNRGLLYCERHGRYSLAETQSD